MLRYLLIDEDGKVHDRTAATYYDAVSEVGPEGWNRVQLTRDLAAFVNDCGLILPDKYRRNPVGGALLHALGGPPIPYAGPIVLAGWDQTRTYDDEPEVVSLTDLQAVTFRHLARHFAAIVKGVAPAAFRADEIVAVNAAADEVRGGAIPGITVTSL